MAGIATSVIPLLSAWEKYINEHPNGDMPGFARWVLAQQPTQTPQQAQPPATPPETLTFPPAPTLPTTAHLGLLIDRLHRFLGLRSKPIIKSLGFTKPMEFALVAYVAILDHPNKKQLCQQLLIENSTGVEVTRRMAKKGIIAEEPNPNDRRSARLSITEKGKKLLMKGSEPFTTMHTTFFEALTGEEQKQLVTLLSRINQYQSARLNDIPDLAGIAP
ncbi:MarR family winged helix-turn-helix transcriptional regulator [Puia dinghuensis]|uniref:HTH marR-type domain-containing protein n=1 Tax=Puia dinghuensis TaxID=1792502 RepID=A0A8J2UHM6_9BACT|nr:MarR family winged helix-turn-helix transcriptional regulator [Puia dinghuensis]GGB17009.1 hypothetical protein GCM10011511_45990 [Puia dinghuensis]